MGLRQLHIDNTFLKGGLVEDIYMKITLGLESSDN